MEVVSIIANPPTTWEVTTLGKVCEEGGGDIQTGPFGSQLHASDYVNDGIPSVMPVNIGDSRILTDGICRITEADAQRLSRYRLRAGDIVYSRRGDVERLALVRDKEDGWLCGTGCLRARFGKNKVNPLYASYYLGHPSVRQWVVQHAIGATMPNLNTGILSALPFLCPPLPVQHRIADILGSLDDKIELNRRTNETLEAMARALFKSWFVDFDPVVAKSEGRKPEGMDADTANLFPSSFEDSEIGRVPRGWIAERLTNLTTPTKGTSYTSDELHESTTALVTLKSFKRGGGYRHDGLKPYTGRYKPEQVVTPGEVVMACTDVTQAAEVVGRPAIVEADPLFQTLVASLDTVIIRPSRKAIPKSFIFCLLKTDDFQNHTYAHCTGTTVLHLSKEALPSFRLPLPSDQVLDAFARLAAPLFARMAVNNTEVCSIGSLRDALLPRLLSGDLRNDIEGEYV